MINLSQEQKLKTNQNSNKLQVLIVGAGIAGLALAQSIDINFSDKIDYTIIEKDESFEQRKQGYSLTIQSNGQKVLQKLNLIQELNKTPDLIKGRGHQLYNQSGQLLNKPLKKQRKNVSSDYEHFFLPRQQVRKILLGQKSILWGYQVNEIKQLQNFKIQVDFKYKDKIIEQNKVFDIVFSCEGVFSKLRNQFIKDKPIYLGLNMINGIIDVSKKSIKNIHSYSIVDQTSHRLFFKPFQKGQMMWQLTSVMGLEEAKQLACGKEEKWIQYVQENLKNWKHPILESIFNTDKNQMRCGPLFYRNSIQQKVNLNNIIFLGDAIHPIAKKVQEQSVQRVFETHPLIDQQYKDIVYLQIENQITK